MAKTKTFSPKKPTVKKSESSFLNSFNIDTVIPPKFQVWVYLALLLVLFLIYLSPLYFQGKMFQSSDIVAIDAAKPYLDKERDGFTLWNPHIFTGMPAYAISVSYTWFNLIYVGLTAVRDLFTSFFAQKYAQWSFYLIVLAFTSFFFMRHISRNNLISLFVAISTSISTGIIVFLYIGHVTKLTALCMVPLLFLMLYRMQKGVKLIDFFALGIALQIFIQGFHVQIIFYTLFSFAVYFIYYYASAFKEKNKDLIRNLTKSLVVTAVAGIIAVAIAGDNLTQVYEYTPHSTRGSASITETSNQDTKQSQVEFYRYHTDWSFSPGEVLTFIVPSFYGFGNSSQELQPGREFKVNTYFGQMPFVDVAMYMGVVVFFLALFGMITMWKEKAVRFFTILMVIALLIAFGKNFPVFFDLMFYYFPYFDKFRVPSMFLVIVQLIFPVLAGFGLMKIISLIEHRDEFAQKLLKYSAFSFGALTILSLLANSVLVSWFTSRMAASEAGERLISGYKQYNIDIASIAGTMFATDTLFAMLFSAVVFFTAYLYAEKKLSMSLFLITACIVTLIDLGRISSRGADYTDSTQLQQTYNEPDYVKFINTSEDKSNPFRILNLKQDRSPGSVGANNNLNAYFLLEDAFGYSAIKPRNYQDFMDVLGGPITPAFWDMTGVKYLIFDNPGYATPGLQPVYANETDKTYIFRNDGALNRLSFIDSVATLGRLEFLNLTKANGFQASKVAYLHDESLQVDKPDSTAFVKITKYADESIEALVKASGNNFLFFNTSYHAKGWKAFIDGEETQIYNANHNFMGIIVPKGEHKIEFKFAPTSWFLSVYVSLGLSSFLILGLITTLALNYFKSKKEEEPDYKTEKPDIE